MATRFSFDRLGGKAGQSALRGTDYLAGVRGLVDCGQFLLQPGVKCRAPLEIPARARKDEGVLRRRDEGTVGLGGDGEALGCREQLPPGW